MCRIDRFEFKWSNVQLIKQHKTKMCRLREVWAQRIDLGLILLESVLLFQVTYCSVTKLISPNSTMSVNDFYEYKSTPHTNQMNYIQNKKTRGHKYIQIGGGGFPGHSNWLQECFSFLHQGACHHIHHFCHL